MKALKFSGRKDSKELYSTNSQFSVLYIITNKWEDGEISNGINIQKISKYKSEKEILFQPFSFYYLKKVDINLSKFTADIYLETIGKTEIFEEQLKFGKKIFYDGSQNIMRFKDWIKIIE